MRIRADQTYDPLQAAIDILEREEFTDEPEYLAGLLDSATTDGRREADEEWARELELCIDDWTYDTEAARDVVCVLLNIGNQMLGDAWCERVEARYERRMKDNDGWPDWPSPDYQRRADR